MPDPSTQKSLFSKLSLLKKRVQKPSHHYCQHATSVNLTNVIDKMFLHRINLQNLSFRYKLKVTQAINQSNMPKWYKGKAKPRGLNN